jgi:hypothetical protein
MTGIEVAEIGCTRARRNLQISEFGVRAAMVATRDPVSRVAERVRVYEAIEHQKRLAVPA